MQAKYIGDKTNPNEVIPDEFEAFGVVFEKGKFSDVPDEYAAKFAGNSHFETKGDASAKPE